jgi:hypothetical protein
MVSDVQYICSQGYLCFVVERPSEYQDQRLECDRTESTSFLPLHHAPSHTEQIDPHRRHVDKSVVAHFWKTLDTWTMSNKPWLMKV